MKNVEIHSKKCGSGDIVIVDVDLAMAQDSTGPLAIRSLNEMGIERQEGTAA
jgi:homoaconitase/3-isopropylmalate dehydratase large subunit